MQAYPDHLDELTVERRRDAFCGKISVCNNLRQYGYRFTDIAAHRASTSESFKQDLINFIGVCKVVNGLRNADCAVGARPNNFNTVRFSRKLLQSHISVPRRSVEYSAKRRES